MKQYTKKFAVAATMAIGLAAFNAAQAQTINFSDLDASYIGAPYSGWFPSATTGITPTGIQVTANSTSYGGLYYDLSDSPYGALNLNANDTLVTLTLTFSGVASADSVAWVGTPFQLNDNAGGGTFPLSANDYSGYNNPGSPAGFTWVQNSESSYTLTETGNLTADEITAAQSEGGLWLYGFNLNIDPAALPAPYTVTFNSLTFSAVPEPVSMALVGLGAAGLLIARRRK
ncbi:MAG TPA: PEP-CTERM sorting domain-containing protein [Verrucomicrobiae bacterium]|nr:PEP-CTERM sorting domain-containing protein [Verrucomicrobiae bacterium]